MASKIFEVGDVLPATTQLRISWTPSLTISYLKNKSFVEMNETAWYRSQEDSAWMIGYNGGPIGSFDIGYIHIVHYDNVGMGDGDFWYSPYNTQKYVDIDTSDWGIDKRTVITVNNNDFFWEVIPSGYTITFEENGGTSVTDLTEQTALPDPLPTPTKEGYKFVAWYYESNFQTRAKAGDTIEANTTLYAKWHNLGSLFTEIADAIRSKDGTSENIRDVDFGERIRNLESGGGETPYLTIKFVGWVHAVFGTGFKISTDAWGDIIFPGGGLYYEDITFATNNASATSYTFGEDASGSYNYYGHITINGVRTNFSSTVHSVTINTSSLLATNNIIEFEPSNNNPV